MASNNLYDLSDMPLFDFLNALSKGFFIGVIKSTC